MIAPDVFADTLGTLLVVIIVVGYFKASDTCTFAEFEAFFAEFEAVITDLFNMVIGIAMTIGAFVLFFGAIGWALNLFV